MKKAVITARPSALIPDTWRISVYITGDPDWEDGEYDVNRCKRSNKLTTMIRLEREYKEAGYEVEHIIED